MNKAFLWLIKKGKKASKYFIFSLFFSFISFLGINSLVSAASISDISSNNSKVGTSAGDLTTIDGQLTNICSFAGDSANLAYTIKSSSYAGNNTKATTGECISYTKGTTQYFYVQATDSTSSTNKITFTVTSPSKYNYVVATEPNYSLSNVSNYDYDLYTLSSDGGSYSLKRIYKTGEKSNSGLLSVTGSESTYTFTFTYELRNSDYGEHRALVYFYTAEPSTNNETKKTELSFTLAKPINDYKFATFTTTDSCDLVGSNANSVCLVYAPSYNSGSVTTGTTVTNKFTIKFSNKAAFYFSTVNTHTSTTEGYPQVSDVNKYNSIYATNTFYNEGESGDNKIVYHYFNLKDTSDYNYAITTKANNYYNFELTIDASGKYEFFLTDIFGNTLTPSTHNDDSDNIDVDDVSNRTLTIYYLAYNADSDTLSAHGESIDNFELAGDLSILTNNNVRIGLEFYYKIDISGDYAVQSSTRGILMNPLYYEDTEKQIRISTDSATNYTYFCRRADSSSSECASNGNGSNFTQHELYGTQEISENTTTGLKALTNSFTFKEGVITTGAGISTTRRKNRVDFYVNENGRFQIQLQDIYGNTKSSLIDVSIIDQLKPVITVNGTSSLTNYICSSMYVIGAGGTIKDYPTTALSSTSCGTNSVTYNHFESTEGREKGDTITVKVERNGTQGSNTVETNGFYNIGTKSISFSYADAIRIALLRVTDSLTTYGSTTSTEKSIYEKASGNDYYTSYSLYSLKNDALTNEDITSSTTRINYGNDLIIANNYLQYSSELLKYSTGTLEMVSFTIYLVDATGNKTSDPVCNSVTHGDNCYNIVNTYIDKAIDFEMVFVAEDYVGNESLPITVRVDVIDDTTPGIASYDADTKALSTDPIIAGNNLDTTCRLEIGSVIQNKNKLLECYGLLTTDGQYNFVDNATTYEFMNASNYSSNRYYTNILFNQLYDTYDNYIKVYVCQKVGKEQCSGDEWKEVQSTTSLVFDNAGSYEIKFVISDNKDYHGNSNSNTTTIILCYYVNPRVLLVRPIETTKEYGATNPTIEYCVYATKNTNAFYYNLFNISGGGYADTYDFVLKNYESSDFGLVYCTSASFTDDTSATKYDSLTTILASSDASLTGSLARTYATGDNKYNLNYTAHNAYEDAGYYRITMGNLAIDSAHKNNYVLRLHPAYLLDGEIPDTSLKNYNELTTQRTYGNTANADNKSETISNVLYTITQAKLTITANGGSKVYGNTDTNYSQAFNTSASTNISSLTYTSNTVSVSTSGYLNGYTVSGLIDNEIVKDYYYNNGTSDIYQYINIISGYLRREAGENVGKYYICNSNLGINNSKDHTSCSFNGFTINTLGTAVTLTSGDSGNVYKLVSSSTYTHSDDITYGRYVEIGGVYYKLTRNNTNLTNLTFDNDMAANLWRYNYDDSDYSIKILVNANNGNQNYYIEYQDAIYTINPQTLIVQPGINQGKEYSNPAHNDPIYELVVYGETVSITSIVVTGSSFNGYTETIAAIGYPNDPSYNTAHYQSTANSKVVDTELYFSDRRTTSREVTGVTYTYKFDPITLVGNEFTLDGVTYVYSSSTDKICSKLNQVSECISNGGKIGINIVNVSDNKVTVTWEGKLTYQNYNLFTSNGTPGTGYITRVEGEIVGWYSYNFSSNNLYVVSNGKNFCSNESHTYIVGSTASGDCVNYNVEFVKRAPSKVTSDDNSIEYVTSTSNNNYLHNGTTYCDSTSTYSVSCVSGDGTTVDEIKFLIFKRDIIISFNAASETYGQVYSYFKDGIFKIADSQTSAPSIITCYKKDEDGIYAASNGKKYTIITNTDCNTTDYGLSTGDTWGSDGLNLKFYLHDDIATRFIETYYPIPAGTYWVYASIGVDNLHANYNLVYIDYDVIETAKAEKGGTYQGGSLEITPREVTLTGTYYQKEYGQAVYATYATNGTALTNSGNYIQGVMSAYLTNTKQINIFDNNYYYCEKTTTTYNGKNIATGCGTMSHSSTDDKYDYNSIANVYGYTVSGVSGESGMISLINGKIDEIFANFAGTPVRARSNAIEDDRYGLLDASGFYTISLSEIEAVVANYYYDDPDGTRKLFEFSTTNGTIYRNTNYSITSRTAGALYITPASIEITVTEGQTKMYGCAYNTLNTNTAISTYTYGSGYSNCVETVAQYYDLGYEYIVSGDKTNYLKKDTTRYTSFNSCSSMADRETGNCNDISYPTTTTNAGYGDYVYKVTPNYNTNGGGNNKPTNTALNSGTLYRIYTTSDTTTYDYSDYYTLAGKAQLDINNALFQGQKVGTYAITLGNLDASFNSNNQCNGYSLPVSSGASSLCKNFIINYGGNNTSTHTQTSSNNDTFDSTSKQFTLATNSFKFTITTRNIVITTEYNYKVYGDTEPDEGFTCANLKDMYTYPSGFGTEFSYVGRDYCSADNTFISTGVTRFYAIDNSLAKAPWNGWINKEETTSSTTSQTYKLYNDTLYDVISSTSQINRKGEGNNAKDIDDAVGKYAYVYYLSLNEGLNGNNYEINYLIGIEDSSGASTNESTIGFAKTNTTDSLISLDRWYTDTNHKCLNDNCNSYDGTQTYQFAINGITYNNTNSYKIDSTTITSLLTSDVYFEIVRREIYIQTQAVEKDYGIEDNYNMFNVKLCGTYVDGICTEIAKATTWGVRNSLSKADYDAFYSSGTFSQSAFKGSVDDATYRGTTTGDFARAFGIYFYRTYGENKGSYVIVACATQYENDTTCRNEYSTGINNEEDRKSAINVFTHAANNSYNASNYIVKTIPSTITIKVREVTIVPDEGQGFMYGNYETGTLIAPITYKEYYKYGETNSSGLVNGSLISGSGDTINNQIALCIYDISERLTCINDRQNSSGGTIQGYVTTGLHGAYDSSITITKTIGVNVYNDSYTEDNDTSRFALTRVESNHTSTDARYNRNVGTYTITAGELVNTTEDSYCGYDNKTTNCLNTNYAIIGFVTGVEYNITPATVIVTPKDNQNKTYGESDVEITFTVTTKFELVIPNDDLYYCPVDNNHCQYITDTTHSSFTNLDSYELSTRLVTLNGFAYSENDSNVDNHNYGNSKVSNKTNTSKEIASIYIDVNDGANNPKYYDKYCYSGSNCVSYNTTNQYASLTYGSTSRILLGYFYVNGWSQAAGDYTIYSGIAIANNEFNNQNYLYKKSYTDSVEIAMGANTEIAFTINKLDVTATIVDVTKVYGQATDSHKCDYVDGCNTDYATLSASDNEGRLEYNFNVSGNGVNTLDSKTILTVAVNGKYYTQTSLPEYKNIHLGLTVVRAINNDNACISTIDKYGCEDVGVYTLVFRKESVTNNVDNNYNIKFGVSGAGVTKSISENVSGYAIVGSTTTSKDETQGTAKENVSYIIYSSDSGIDTVSTSQNSATSNNSTNINIVSDYSGTITINKRDVTFYVGTYNSDGTVAERYIIEQNEQVPEFPQLNAGFTTSTTSVTSKRVYYVTWFDTNEYGKEAVDTTKTNVPRQVRTSDTLIRNVETYGSDDTYGVVICKKSSTDIGSEKYGQGNCTDTVKYADANKIDSDGKYVFDTTIVGDYAILRNVETTYIVSKDNETKNYATVDVNGVLVIYEDQTAPIIQVGNDNFVLEANANLATCTTEQVTNISGQSFSYNCSVSGLLFDENNKQLGNIIKYLTNNYSGYNSATNNYESITKLPDSVADSLSDTWGVYYPVNNIGVISSASNTTTLYGVDRITNTYDFDTNYINSNLEAITSIISWFNINSYDYSYVRGDYVSKRYTPRYYIYINNNDKLTTFDPTYVGDFTITIYAIDNMGNRSSATVTLNIVDTTKPTTGEMHLFNAEVVCGSATSCKTNTIDSWFVKAGYVSIDAFIKYNSLGVEDDTNGTYIKLNGSLVSLYSVNRYLNVNDTTTNILGRYVKVNANSTPAVEVEHKYWSNISTKYLVIVGGKDNSYIDPDTVDEKSQWDTYYTVDGTDWYKYNRHSTTGVTITFKDGVNTIFTRVLDSGRNYSLSITENGYEYYDNVYLRLTSDSSDACDGLTDCINITGDIDITQVKDIGVTKVTGSDYEYTTKIQSITVTLNTETHKATWQGQQEAATISDDREFKFGIMTCTVNEEYNKVSCVSKYNLVTNNKKTVNKPAYTVGEVSSSRNIGDWDSITDSITNFYKDRRYIFIDTSSPVIDSLNGNGYSIYEYANTCQVNDNIDSICSESYREKFLNASDGINASNATTTVDGSTISITNLNNTGYTDIVYYNGSEFSKVTSASNVTSGLLVNDSLIMQGTTSLSNTSETTGEVVATTFNKLHLDLSVYLNVDSVNASGTLTTTKYRYLAIFNGEKYYVIKQELISSTYADITSFSDTNLTNYTTVEDVLQYIVSTASIDTSEKGSNLTFSINYVIRDAANNASAPVANLTVRGITYTKLTSNIAVTVSSTPTTENAGQSLELVGDNIYQVNVNQGMSLSTLLNGFTVSNVNNDGVNNMNSVKQSLYYNGEVIFENLDYDSDILSIIDNYMGVPGLYTLKLTSTRTVSSQGLSYTVSDKPLEININVSPLVATINSDTNYASSIIIAISIALASIAILGLGYISLRKHKR